eukprot:3732044-Pyramimonas_sp.AAC.1
MKEPQVPITLNAAGGLSSALGTVRVACDRLLSGKFDAIVLPETPSVISVGELCVDHGHSFYWQSGNMPYLLLPNGMRVDLTVDDNIPYLNIGGGEALGLVDEAAPAYLLGLAQWACVEANAESGLIIPSKREAPRSGRSGTAQPWTCSRTK